MSASVRWIVFLIVTVSPVFASETKDMQAMIGAMSACRKEPAALERLTCYDRILTPEPDAGFAGALVKAKYAGEAHGRAFEQEKQRGSDSTQLLINHNDGEHPTVIITTPAIGSLPPRPVLMLSCVDNITRMQVALTHSIQESDIAVTLRTEKGQFRSHWFVRENGLLLETSRGLAGIEDIKQLFGAKTLKLDTDLASGTGALTFNIEGLEQVIMPLREVCHWAGE